LPADPRQLFQQAQDPAIELVTDHTNLLEGFPGRVHQLPIFVPDPREDRARVAAAHRDHDVDVPHDLVSQELRSLGRDVDSDLRHRLDDRGVEVIGRLRPGRAHPDPSRRVLLEERGRHLTASGVVDTDEEDLWEIDSFHPEGRIVGGRIRDRALDGRGRNVPWTLGLGAAMMDG
jgi:hypothetical protein